MTLVASATLGKGDDAVEHVEAGCGLEDLIPVEPEDLVSGAARDDAYAMGGAGYGLRRSVRVAYFRIRTS